MPIIIEFLGHGGSGKTFISKQLNNLLGKDSILAADVKINISDVLWFIVKYPLHLMDIILFILSTKQKSLNRNIRYVNLLLRYNVKIAKLKNLDKRYVIMDAGILHRFRSIRETSDINDLIYDKIKTRYRKNIFSRADVIIHVIASIETINLRKLKRRYGEVDGAIIQRGLKIIKNDILERSKYSEYDIASAMKEQKFLYIEVDNDGNESIKKIISDIKESIYSISPVS
jgi:hypothetical protein